MQYGERVVVRVNAVFLFEGHVHCRWQRDVDCLNTLQSGVPVRLTTLVYTQKRCVRVFVCVCVCV